MNNFEKLLEFVLIPNSKEQKIALEFKLLFISSNNT